MPNSPSSLPPLPGSREIAPASEIWGSSAWHTEALEWIDEALARRGVERADKPVLQPRIRPWSTLLMVETVRQGRLWFKASTPEMTPEPAVLRWLRTVSGDAVPAVWADDDERRWVLMPHQGPRLVDVETDENRVQQMSAVLRRYARIQRGSVAVVPDLIAAGVPDLPPREISREWTGLHLRPDTSRQMRLAAMRLEDVGLPMTIQHDDLHAANVFADGTTAGMHESRIFDWADASVGSPLTSLLTPLEMTTRGMDDEQARDVRARLIRAYVSSWSDIVPTHKLTEAIEDALVIARAGRVLTWRRALSRASAEERTKWGAAGQRHIREINAALQQ